jgi:transcriptional regulator with PAS, ATPase and Fis domain
VRHASGQGYTRPSVVPKIILEDLDLETAERRLCLEALREGGNIVNAAKLLGITRHALKRRIIKLDIAWPPPDGSRPE